MTERQLTPRQRTLLAWIHDSGVEQLDPIRIMKGQFLVAMETPAEWLPDEARYKFEPYNWGPYSVDIYRDLSALQELGLVIADHQPGKSWALYSLSEEGSSVAESINAGMLPDLVQYFTDVGRFVGEKSFSDLLRAVYKRYPAFAVNSVFKG